MTIDLAEHLGGETYFYCSCPGLAQLTVHESGQLMRQRGDTLGLRVRRDHLHLFDRQERALMHGVALANP